MFRDLFPSFEKPVERPRYLHVETESRNFRGIGIVLVLAACCGVALALWEPSHQVTSPFTTASSARSTSASAPAETVAAAAVVEDDQSTPTVKLSTLCSQRATARRDCASVKALKDARVNAPDSEPAEESKPPAVAAKPEPTVAVKADAAVEPAVAAPAVVRQAAPATAAELSANAQPEVAAAPPPKPAPKVKRPRPVEEPPIERLVRVYDQVMPDGRRVPVYKRVGSGTYEIGTIVDGEYRPARRASANLDSPPGRYYGLQ